MTKSTITRERIEQYANDPRMCNINDEIRELASMALAAMDSSESVEMPLDYLQGHKDGLEWASQLAEANHPETGDWLYDDPIELAKAIRKGPDMSPVQPVADSEPVAYMTYKGYLLHAGDPKLAEYSEPMPLYADPRPEPISADPVAWLLSGGGAKNVVVFDGGNAYADPLREVTPLYRHAQQPVVPEKATAGEMPFLGTSEGAYVRGWNDCRAAMLQENAKSAGVSNNCRSSENVHVMQDRQIRELVNQLRDIAVKYHAAGQLREQIARVIRAAMLQAGNSQVIPDGYVMVPKEPTEQMYDAGDRQMATKQVWDAMLAAAPQQHNAPQNIPEIIPGWIPVSERMPESNGVYFGWDGKRVLEVNCFFGGFSANQFIHGEITHWMPLPAAPQEVKGD